MHNKDYYILLSILGNIDKILKYSSGYKSATAFYENDRDFDASMMNFIVIGEQVGKLSNELKNKNSQINWSKIYSFRNIVAHHYFGINVDIVWQIIQNDLQDFKEQISSLVK
jgi:uncharacterized protein with HEPN domain